MQEIHTDLEGAVTLMDDEVKTHVESPVEEDPLDRDAQFFERLLRMPDQNRMTIGMQLAAKYYGNSAERYRSREEKHYSLSKLAKRLAERKVVHVSKSLLANCLAAHFSETELGLTSTDAALLSFNARVELLRESDPKRKVELARRAIDERLSVRELRVLIRGESAIGRKNAVTRLLEMAARIEKLVTSGPTIGEEAITDLRAAIDALDRSNAALRVLMDEFAPRG